MSLLTFGKTQLENLNLSQNMVTEEGADYLCKALEKTKTLKVLKIAANGLGRAFGKELSRVLATNSSLEFLNICSNDIGSEGGKDLQARFYNV